MIFKNKIEALLDLESKINIINKVFALKLGLKIQKTNVGIQKIDDTTLKK